MKRAGIAAIVLSLVLMLAGLLCGCASRDYYYRTPDGCELGIRIRGSDTQIGKLKATAPDGSSLELENLSTQDRTVEALRASLDTISGLAGKAMP